MKTTTTTTHIQPEIAYRAAIWNQIHTTIYYVVSVYELNPQTGKYAFKGSFGKRSGKSGYGLALGMSKGDAYRRAKELNAKAGWSTETPNAPRFISKNL